MPKRVDRIFSDKHFFSYIHYVHPFKFSMSSQTVRLLFVLKIQTKKSGREYMVLHAGWISGSWKIIFFCSYLLPTSVSLNKPYIFYDFVPVVVFLCVYILRILYQLWPSCAYIFYEFHSTYHFWAFTNIHPLISRS